MNHSQIVNFVWGVADLIRDTFKRGKYQDVILPLPVLRRLGCVLAPTKPKVLATQAKLKQQKLENPEPQLRKASGFAFYNTSLYDFEKLLADSPHLAANLRNYIAGFSPNMREVLENVVNAQRLTHFAAFHRSKIDPPSAPVLAVRPTIRPAPAC